jgi:hypothetical protein
MSRSNKDHIPLNGATRKLQESRNKSILLRKQYHINLERHP